LLARQSERFLEIGSLHPPLAALRRFPRRPLHKTPVERPVFFFSASFSALTGTFCAPARPSLPTAAKGNECASIFLRLVREKRCRPPKRDRFCDRAQLLFRLVFCNWQRRKRRRTGSATESAAADPVREGVPSTDL